MIWRALKLLAEIGVVVLLFTVGLEISISRLLAMLPLMASIGLPQIAGTTFLIAAACRWHVGTLPQAIFAGLLIAMSSTAIVPETFIRSEPIRYSGRTNLNIGSFAARLICDYRNACGAFVSGFGWR